MRKKKKQGQSKHRKKRQRPIFNSLKNIVLILLLLFALGLIFNNQIKNWVLRDMIHKNDISLLSPKDIEENNKKEASFDGDAVESIDFNAVINARLNPEEVAILGGIAIPSVELNLPIIKGMTNYSLIVGAGTMKKDQEMGKGNYALASHHMVDKDMLFSPLVRIEKGSDIYLTDLTYVYIYETDYIEYVAPDSWYLVLDVPNKTQVTLVTCDATGENRLVVQGTFKKKLLGKDAPVEILQAFDLKINNYQ